MLEIGPGRGVLTSRLLATGAQVVAIEADASLAQELRSRFLSLELIEADATRFDYRQLGEGPYILVSNLPYNVSKPLLSIFYAERLRFPRWVLMLQKELADRLVAKPGTKNWGPLGILLQNVARIEPIARLKPGSFWPPPKVDSMVLRFEIRAAPLHAMGPDERAFAQALFELFQERRKTLRNRLQALGLKLDLVSVFGLTGGERVEQLPPEILFPLVRCVLGSSRT